MRGGKSFAGQRVAIGAHLYCKIRVLSRLTAESRYFDTATNSRQSTARPVLVIARVNMDLGSKDLNSRKPRAQRENRRAGVHFSVEVSVAIVYLLGMSQTLEKRVEELEHRLAELTSSITARKPRKKNWQKTFGLSRGDEELRMGLGFDRDCGYICPHGNSNRHPRRRSTNSPIAKERSLAANSLRSARR